MKIMIAVKRVVDYSVKVRVNPQGTGFELEGVKMSLNPFDEIAVEEAVRLKEKGIASSLTAVSIGPSACQETLRAALALGVDSAILIETSLETQPLGVAKGLKHLVERDKPDLVLLGKQAIDDDFNQTGQMLAALLDWPQGTFASKLEVKGKELEVTREVDGGLETLKMPLPAVITTDLRLNEPRYATLPNIMKAKQKPLEILQAESLGVDLAPRLQTVRLMNPPPRKPGVLVENVDDLVEKLTAEAKVIP